MGTAWGDFDGDADLDLYVLNHHWCFPGRRTPNQNDQLYRNEGGEFVEVSELLQGEALDDYGFTGIFVDYDLDGDQDLMTIQDHVGVEDSAGPNLLWVNDGDSFHPLPTEAGYSVPVDPWGKGANAMGGDIGDLNHDGRPDLAFSNIGPNFVLLSDGTDFVDVTSEWGARHDVQPWGTNSITWGVLLADFDNDADLDLFFSAGALVLEGGLPQPGVYLENLGGAFVDRTWPAGVDSPTAGRATALVDLDGDGWLDFLVANWDDEVEVYRNRLGVNSDAHWLMVDLVGDGVHVSRDALGATVSVETDDGLRHTCFRNPRPSLSAAGDPVCHFGLGAQDHVDEVRITWPDGTEVSVDPGGVDQRIEVAY